MQLQKNMRKIKLKDEKRYGILKGYLIFNAEKLMN